MYGTTLRPRAISSAEFAYRASNAPAASKPTGEEHDVRILELRRFDFERGSLQ